jgi:predicted Zn-dependent protease
MYEQALRTLQQHNFAKAADLLQHMVAGFPEERELIERSRVYLALCERHLRPLAAEPQNTAERLYAVTIALNDRRLDDAVGHLERILQDDPAHDQALYMLAVTHAQRDATADAIRYLQRAIAANPENRAFARMDPDLDDLREDEGVMALLSARDEPRIHEQRRARRK